MCLLMCWGVLWVFTPYAAPFVLWYHSFSTLSNQQQQLGRLHFEISCTAVSFNWVMTTSSVLGELVWMRPMRACITKHNSASGNAVGIAIHAR
jgi:hypothetical protein